MDSVLDSLITVALTMCVKLYSRFSEHSMVNFLSTDKDILIRQKRVDLVRNNIV